LYEADYETKTQTFIISVVETHSAKADFCFSVLRTPKPKEMCFNAPYCGKTVEFFKLT